MSQTTKRDTSLTIRRVVAVLLLILIIPTTVSAFWLFNGNRVVLDPNTYRNSLNNRAVYNDLLVALLGGFVGNNPLPRRAEVLVPGMSQGGSSIVAEILFPSIYAQRQIDDTINQLNNWLDGKIDVPNIVLDLKPLKANLAGSAAMQAVGEYLKTVGTCRNAQDSDRVKNFADTDSFDKLPIPLCLPSNLPDVGGLQKQLAAGLAIIGNVLPDSWKLSDELANITPIDPGSSNVNVSIRPPRPNQMDSSSLAHARVGIWLQARLMVLLFLIPIALICLIVIVIVRSSKTFFRWLSWALILSGFVSLIPVIVIAVSGVGGKAGGIHIYNSATGISEIALNSLAGGAVQSIVSTLILGVLIQVAILIVVGLVAAFISILLTTPEPLLSDADLEAFIAAQGGSISTAASGTR